MQEYTILHNIRLLLLRCSKISYYKISNHFSMLNDTLLKGTKIFITLSKILYHQMLIVLYLCLRTLFYKIASGCYHYAKRYYITRYKTFVIIMLQIFYYKIFTFVIIMLKVTLLQDIKQLLSLFLKIFHHKISTICYHRDQMYSITK